jgi:hypothetical protein
MALNQNEVDVGILVNLCVAVPVSVSIMWLDVLKYQALPLSRRKGSFQSTVLLMAMSLAVVTLLVALLGYFDWSNSREIVLFDPGIPTQNLSYHKTIRLPSLPSALLITFFSAFALGLDAYLAWNCYLLGKSIEGEVVPPWQTRTAHIYIWFFNILPFLAYNAPGQVFARSIRLVDALLSPRVFLLGASWFFASSLLHLLLSPAFVLTFIRNLNRLAAHPHVLQHHHPQTILDLQKLGVRLVVYATGR